MMWMIGAVVLLALFGWKVLHNAQEADKRKPVTRKNW